MGRPAGWMHKFTGRGAMRSPGALSHRREIERRFWEQIATGITSEKAAEAVGVSQRDSAPVAGMVEISFAKATVRINGAVNFATIAAVLRGLRS